MRVLLSVLILLAVAAPVAAQVPPPPEALGDAYDAAMEASPTPRQLEADQRDWVRYREADEYGTGAEGDDERIDYLNRLAARDRALGQIVLPNADLPNACIGEALKGCSSRAGGWLTAPDGQRLYWQMQDGFTDETGVSGGFVLLGDAGAARMGPIKPIGWAYEGYRYEAPVSLFIDGHLYVAVSGRMQGTGNGNADVLFRWTPGETRELTQVDNWSWRESLAEQLPRGLEVWKGVDYRYNDEGVWAWTLLWREGDGNCCASGGSAMLEFRIEDDRLILHTVSPRDAIVEVAISEPIEVLDFVGRASMCAHWGGEEPYDADRRAEIEAAVTELRCEALPAEAARLKAQYADDRATLALLTRVTAE